jgi:hypothetical protein
VSVELPLNARHQDGPVDEEREHAHQGPEENGLAPAEAALPESDHETE